MATVITKRSSTASAVPVAGDLQVGELAVNTADGKLFTKHTDNSIKEIGSGGAGGSSWTRYEVNLGSQPRSDFKFTITDAAISSTSKIAVVPDGKPATARGQDDWQWDTASFAANPSTGTCTVYARFDGRVKGLRNILYQVT